MNGQARVVVGFSERSQPAPGGVGVRVCFGPQATDPESSAHSPPAFRPHLHGVVVSESETQNPKLPRCSSWSAGSDTVGAWRSLATACSWWRASSCC